MATYNTENSQARRYITDAMRVLGDEAGDLAELVAVVNFMVKKEEGGGEGDIGEEEGEGGVKKVGKKLLIEMVDRGWEAEWQGRGLREGGEDGGKGFRGGGGGEGGLWEVYEEEMGVLMGKREKMLLKERWVCILILTHGYIYLCCLLLDKLI